MEGKTVISEFIEKPVQSFFVNAGLSDENAQQLSLVQDELVQVLPDVIWASPRNALHITLVDLLSARVDYNADKLQLFQSHFNEYDAALQDILKDQHAIEVKFSQVKTTPEAIIIVGEDNGSFARIRNAFSERVQLLSGTKPAPQIIHSSLCRYKQQADLEPIQEFVSKQRISFTEHINSFRLTREVVWSLVQFELVKKYKLKA